MEQIFAGYPCAVIVDDIIVGGNGEEEHDKNLKKVLDRAREVNLRLNPLKCKFRQREIGYVGHIFKSDGLKPDPSKTRAIAEMPAPDNVAALKLGVINYMARFIPNISEVSAPLHQLTHKDCDWCWYEQHQNAFDTLKRSLASPPTLRYYDVKKPVTLTCDASQYGLGAACLQDGAPIAYASRSLTPTEILTTNRWSLFCQNPYTRLQRMMLRLQRRKGKHMYLADTLSRAPMKTTEQHSNEEAYSEVMTIQ